jgi:hypothetical protein
MMNKKRLFIGLALALAGAMLWANLSWAQAQGGGACGAANAPAGSACTVQGGGTGGVCTVTPPPSCPKHDAKKQGDQGSPGEKAPAPEAKQPKTDK